ncbi:hypothetical protein Tco_1315284 [Tanacetum coccineum]
MDPNSSLVKNYLGDDVVIISSDKVEGLGDWNSLEYQDMVGSKGKKVMNARSFYRMETDEISERYITPCFVNGLEAYDGEINLAFDENLISNEFAIKLCLDYEMKKGTKLFKKELIVALRGELYFVKFIINPEEDDFEPGVILGRSFLRLAKGVVDFGNGVTTIYPKLDLFEVDSEKIGKSSGDWDQLLDFNFDDVPNFGEEPPSFICKMGKSNRNKKRAMENLIFFYQDMGTSSSAGEALNRIKGEALKEKEDPEAFIFPIRLEGKVNENVLADTGSYGNTYKRSLSDRSDYLDAKFLILDILIDSDSPIVVGRGFLHTIGGIVNSQERLFSAFEGFCHQTFHSARSDFMRNTESDSDDEEDYQIKRNKFGAPIYGPKPAPYLNCNDHDERSLAIQTTSGTHDNKAGSSRNKHSRQHKTVEEVLLPQVHHDYLLWEGCNRDAKSRYNTRLAQLLPRHIYSPCIVNWDILNRMGCDGEIDDKLRIKVREAESGEEIFTSVAWIRAFNINNPIYAEFCHEFYSTYEFDEVCASDELGLYQATELDEDGFNVYFEGGLHSDKYFNAQEHWLSISREENLSLSRSHASTIKYPILRVVHKMITYGLCQRTDGYDKIQKNDLWLLSMFDARHHNGYANVAWLITRKSRVLTDDVIRSLSAPIYCRDLDTTTLRKLIDSEGRLVPEDPRPGVPRVGIPRPTRASMQDLYDRMGRKEIRQEAIERTEYMQSYH